MRRIIFVLFLLWPAAGAHIGCVSYHKDYHVTLSSEPTGAEIWKDSYYLGTTPYLLSVTATWEDKEKGTISFPPLTFKKNGFRDETIEVEIALDKKEKREYKVKLEPIPD